MAIPRLLLPHQYLPALLDSHNKGRRVQGIDLYTMSYRDFGLLIPLTSDTHALSLPLALCYCNHTAVKAIGLDLFWFHHGHRPYPLLCLPANTFGLGELASPSTT